MHFLSAAAGRAHWISPMRREPHVRRELGPRTALPRELSGYRGDAIEEPAERAAWTPDEAERPLVIQEPASVRGAGGEQGLASAQWAGLNRPSLNRLVLTGCVPFSRGHTVTWCQRAVGERSVMFFTGTPDHL
ncbi:unnamed protein product [Arctogadus glacialis]